jgi:hypothetical protein
MAKLPHGCTIEKVKDSRGKILAYELRQGDRHWSAPTEAQALAAREADIQRACEEYNTPIILESPTDDPTELLCGFRVLGAWRYSLIRKEIARTGTKKLECHGGYGEYKTRAECERAMRSDAARLAIRIGPYAEGCEVLADGLDYLDASLSGVNTAEDFREQMIHVAYCRADHFARDKGMPDGAPMSPASQYRHDAIECERKRIHDVYKVLSREPIFRYNVAESFRQGRLVSR